MFELKRKKTLTLGFVVVSLLLPFTIWAVNQIHQINYTSATTVYRLVMHANGGNLSDSNRSTIETVNVDKDKLKISSEESDKFSREGFALVGWNSDSKSTVAEYHTGDTVTLPGNDTSIDLYAVWRSIESNPNNIVDNSFSLSFNKNTTDSVLDLPSVMSYNGLDEEYTFTIPEVSPIRSGYLFLGWNYTAEATTATLAPGSAISFPVDINGVTTNDVTLYAVWSEYNTSDNNYNPMSNTSNNTNPPSTTSNETAGTNNDSQNTVLRGPTLGTGTEGNESNEDDSEEFVDEGEDGDEDSEGADESEESTPPKRNKNRQTSDTGNHSITSGTQTITSNSGITIAGSGNSDEFASIYIDGVELGDDDFDITSMDSGKTTLITLKPAYVESLDDGEHTLAMTWVDGRAEATLTRTGNTIVISTDDLIEIPDTSVDTSGITPDTGASTSPKSDGGGGFPFVAIIVALLSGGYTFIRLKRRFYDE